MHPGDHGLQLPNSLLLKATVQSKSKQFFHLLLQHFVGKKPAARVKKRPAAVLEADKPPASEAASVHSKEGSGSGEEKNLTTLNLQEGAVAIREKQSLGRDSCFKFEIPKNPMPNSKAF